MQKNLLVTYKNINLILLHRRKDEKGENPQRLIIAVSDSLCKRKPALERNMFDFFFSRSRLDELPIKRLMCINWFCACAVLRLYDNTCMELQGEKINMLRYATALYIWIYMCIFLCLFNNVYKLKVYKFRHYKANRCTVMILCARFVKTDNGSCRSTVRLKIRHILNNMTV